MRSGKVLSVYLMLYIKMFAMNQCDSYIFVSILQDMVMQ